MTTGPGDFTGMKKARLQAEVEEQQTREAERLAMATASAQRSSSNEIVDYTKPRPKVRKEPTGPGVKREAPVKDLTGDAGKVGAVTDVLVQDEEDEEPVYVRPTSVLIRARYDLENVTIGHGTLYNFEAGRRYRVPWNVAEHLGERDLVDVLE